MKKILLISIASLFYFSLAIAGFEGSGKIKLNSLVIKYFKEYLDTKDHNKKEGAARNGRGWFFFVDKSGEEFGYTYCAQGKTCTTAQTLPKKNCEKNVKKYLKRKEKCYLFAKQRYIVWDGKKIQIKNKATSSEIESILREHGFID